MPFFKILALKAAANHGETVKIFRTFFSLLLISMSTYSTQIQAYGCCENEWCSRSCFDGIYFYLDYLYWKPAQDQMQYAAILPGGIEALIDEASNVPYSISADICLKEPKFQNCSGFRIGIGYILPCSNWDFQLAWARLHQNISSSVCDPNQGIIPTTLPLSTLFNFIGIDPSAYSFANKAKSHWKFEYDAIDFNIGRTCCICCIELRPYLGVKAATIRQNQHIQYYGLIIDYAPIDAINSKKNNFKGVGPSIGLDTAWQFCSNFSLTSGICGALLYGKFDASEHPSVVIDYSSLEFHLCDTKKCRIRPMVDARIGIEWDTCLWCNIKFAAGISYEVQYWWNQWQPAASTMGTLLIGGNSSQGDLMLHGLTLRAAVGF